MTEAEQYALYNLVGAAFDAKGSPAEFEQRLEEIVAPWRNRYEFWLTRNRDRAREKGWFVPAGARSERKAA